MNTLASSLLLLSVVGTGQSPKPSSPISVKVLEGALSAAAQGALQHTWEQTLRYCAWQARRTTPELHGKVVLVAAVSQRKVVEKKIETNTTGDSELGDCLLKSSRGFFEDAARISIEVELAAPPQNHAAPIHVPLDGTEHVYQCVEMEGAVEQFIFSAGDNATNGCLLRPFLQCMLIPGGSHRQCEQQVDRALLGGATCQPVTVNIQEECRDKL